MTLPQLIIEHALQIAVNPRLRHQPTAHTHTDTAHCTLTRSTNMFANAWPHSLCCCSNHFSLGHQSAVSPRQLIETNRQPAHFVSSKGSARGQRPFTRSTNFENSVLPRQNACTSVRARPPRNLRLYREDERHYTLCRHYEKEALRTTTTTAYRTKRAKAA